HIALPQGAPVPVKLAHKVTASFTSVPGPESVFTLSGGETTVSDRQPPVIGPPLAGERYIAAFTCCDSLTHMRAALPVNGEPRLAQRFAVDWVKMDEQNRIIAGPLDQLASHAIYE